MDRRRTAPSTSPPPIAPRISKARCWCLPPRGDEALDRRISDDARAADIPVNAVDRPELCDFFTPALVNRAPLAVAIGTEGAGPVLAQIVRAKIDRLLSPSLGPLALLADFVPRCRRTAAAEGQRAPPLLERLLRRRAGPRHGGRRRGRGARAPLSELLSRSAAVARPHRAGRRRSGRRGPSDAARAPPADGSRRHRPRRAGAGGGRRHGPPRRRAAAGRQAQGLPLQEPGRDQRAAGRARPRGQARRAAEVRRSAGVRPRRRGNGGAARCRRLLRGGAGRHRGLRRRRRFRTAADACAASPRRWCSPPATT